MGYWREENMLVLSKRYLSMNNVKIENNKIYFFMVSYIIDTVTVSVFQCTDT